MRRYTVTSKFPLFVSVTGDEFLAPTLTLPKLRLDLLADSKRLGETPVPLRGIEATRRF
jgi:hypothetical protein